jgi:preprotein translocase subunit SecG
MLILYWIFLPLFLFVCFIMILLVLIQKGRGGGLSSAFGGAGGNTAFGAKTGDVLTWATSVVFGLFVLLAVILTLVIGKMPARASIAPQAQQAPLPGSPTNSNSGK